MKTNQTSRHHAKRITVYNHKGGVGKTTLTINLTFALGDLGYKVLLVDSDPQCNVTAYLLDDVTLDSLLDKSDADDGQTVWSALKPIADGTGLVKIVGPT